MPDSPAPSVSPLAVVLQGATGRMGRAIIGCAEREPDRYAIAGQIGRGDDPRAILARADAVIEFSSADATAPLLRAARELRKPVVVGTTGHDAAQRAEIDDAAAGIPVVFAANFSVGVNTLFWLTRRAAQILGPGFDLEVVEMHHRLKKDAPSGTARRLAEILAEARALDYGRDARHGREGLVGARTPGEIGLHAVRGGDVVGEHTVFFAAAGERVELTHRASSRDTFALGALRAAAWLVGQPPGLYDMEDVLGLRAEGHPPSIGISGPGTPSMNAADRTELYRLRDLLRSIDEQSGLSSEQREALEKAGLALHHVFAGGSRTELEDSHSMIGQPLLESERTYLRSLGVDPDIHRA